MVEQKKTSDMMSEFNQQSSLRKLIPSASAITELFEKINEMLSNSWNEFVSEYDPVESPRAHKTLPGVFHIAGLVLLSTVSALRDLTKKRYSERDISETVLTAPTLIAAVQRECKRRNLTLPKVRFFPVYSALVINL